MRGIVTLVDEVGGKVGSPKIISDWRFSLWRSKERILRSMRPWLFIRFRMKGDWDAKEGPMPNVPSAVPSKFDSEFTARQGIASILAVSENQTWSSQ